MTDLHRSIAWKSLTQGRAEAVGTRVHVEQEARRRQQEQQVGLTVEAGEE